MGINELMDVLNELDQVGRDLAAAKVNDGKISSAEYLKVAFANSSGAVKAFMGLDQVALEVKDMDLAEAQTVVVKLVAIYQSWIKVLAA